MRKPIFRDHKLPAARQHGRLPIFLDFSSGGQTDDSVPPKRINEIISQYTSMIDAILVFPHLLPDLDPKNRKDVWVRVDQASTSTVIGQAGSDYLLQHGISGLVGSLFLGSSASDEADNIQQMAFLRSHCLEIGLPLAIEVQVLAEVESPSMYLELVELGINLAVEVGCNIVIIPGGQYLALENHIAKITEQPVIVMEFAGQGIDQAQETLRKTTVQLNGVILSGVNPCGPSTLNEAIFKKWAGFLPMQPSGR